MGRCDPNCQHQDLAHVPAKWTPVRRQEHAPKKESRACSDCEGTEHALGATSREGAMRARAPGSNRRRGAGAYSGVAPTSDPRVADLVRAGKVRFGIFPPQYTKDAAGGELKGPLVEVMRVLAAHMRLSAELIELSNPSGLVECLRSGACDIGSLGFDLARADQVGGFTPPLMQVEFTYLVPPSFS